jgi:heat shock protein HtpX
MERRPSGRDLGLSARMALSLVLLGGIYLPFFLWLVGMGYVFRHAIGAIVVAVAALGLLAAAPYFSELLALSLARAQLNDEAMARRVRPMLERLCGLADLPVPRLAVISTQVPNAFSAGRSARNAVVVVTLGLLERLEDEELEAVLAHELTHIANRDAFVMTVAAAPALVGRKLLWGFVSLPWSAQSLSGKIGAAFALLYLLPVVFVAWTVYAFATLIVMSISRYRELVADRGAAILTGAPEQLMSALQKIADEVPAIPSEDLRAAATMNAFFVLPAATPSAGFEVDPMRMFPTHPPLARRLERLAELARELGRGDGVPVNADAVSVDTPSPRLDNPQAVGAFILASVVWGSVAGILLTGTGAVATMSLWIPLLGLLVVMLGIFLGLEGAGRASAGASGMGFATTALTLLVGPWALGAVAAVVFVGLTLLGLGPAG